MKRSRLNPVSKKKRDAAGKKGVRSTFKRPTLEELQKKGLVVKASTLKHKGEGERSVAMDAADAAFSKWTRLKAANSDGYLLCFICETRLHWTEAVLMHCEPRICMPTRYSEINCQAGCSGCNGKDNGDRVAFREKIDHRFGRGAAEKIDHRFGRGAAEKNTIASKQMLQMPSGYLRFVANTYESRIIWIRQHEPTKFHDR